MNLDTALEMYIVESRELLQQMEGVLLATAGATAGADDVNAMFRAAHTIKGSAGLFGLDAIVAFTHDVESVLDRVRDGELDIDDGLHGTLLACCDHINRLIELTAEGAAPDPACTSQGHALQVRLQAWLGGAAATAPQPELPAPPAAAAHDGRYWHISLRFGRDVLRNGMDPLSFLRFLGTVGDVLAVATLEDALPAAADMDPESCYLGFEIGLLSQADKAAIEEVFEFVREDCEIRILPPDSKGSDYIDLLRGLPNDETRIGQLLLECGAITRAELDAALLMQAGPDGGAAAPAKPLGEVLVDLAVVREPVVQAALDKQLQAKEARAQEARFIRLDAEKLDILINRIGELVIAGAGISIAAKRAGGTELLEAASTLAALVEDVRDSALQLRMVQIGATFNRFQRVVHDVSRDLGKEIGLSIGGADTELDKTMVERIGDPLMHLVRNAMDHGIEPTSERVARGKPARGTVRLNACHDAGSVVIEVSDDGGGLSRERIVAKAVERGLIAGDQGMTDREVWDLIFEPGFSTASQISNLSGRGVGMDVVRSNVRELRGTVEVESRSGQGTTVRIRLPLTLAIISGFLVRVGESMFVVPLDMVDECVELTPQARAEASGNEYLNLRGRVLPFIQLRELFGIEGRPSTRQNILVVRYGGARAGLVVDELVGEAQTVIKPLAKLFGAVKGIGGSTVLGDGRVALIIDVPGLMQHTQHQAMEGFRAGRDGLDGGRKPGARGSAGALTV